nr:MAG TPA: hypothetical protein [Caudoviricetes sp.]
MIFLFSLSYRLIVVNLLLSFNNTKQTIIIHSYKYFDNFFLSLNDNLHTLSIIYIFVTPNNMFTLWIMNLELPRFSRVKG